MKLSISNSATFPFRHAMIALSFLASTGIASAQTTWYVDDDGPGDPFPGISDPFNNFFSDPLEDGSVQNPFDDLWKAVTAATDGDTVLVLPSNVTGSYFLSQSLDLQNKAITIRGQGGPIATTLDGAGIPGEAGVIADSGETAATVFEGFRLRNFHIGTTAGNQGAAMTILSSSPTIRDCWFESNSAYRGAAMWAFNSTSIIEDCRFVGNASTHQGGAVFTEIAAPTFSRCYFEGNAANYGGAMTSFTSTGKTVTIMDCVFYRNDALVGYGGGLSSHFTGGITVERSRFISNIAPGQGGAFFTTCPAVVRDCTFNSNVSTGDLGAVHAGINTAVTIYGSTFHGNDGIACVESTGANLSIRNSICWNNTPFEFSPTINARFCVVLGGWVGGNLDVDPLFVDPFGPDSILGTLDDDFSLFNGSPCIDSGDSTQLMIGYPVDLVGNPRAVNRPGTTDTGIAVVGQTTDMGAYEFQVISPAPNYDQFRSKGPTKVIL